MTNRELDAQVAELMGDMVYEFPPGIMNGISPYSTDIKAAMPVLNWLRQQFFSTEIVMWDHTDKVAILCYPRQGHNEDTGYLEVDAPTLPEAICKAALKAVGE